MSRHTGHRTPLIGALLAAALLLGSLPATSPASAAAGLNLPRTTVPQAAAVAVSGSGFTAQDTVVVYVDAPVQGHSQRIQTSTTANGNGSFTATLNLPRNVDAGTYTLTARDTHGISASQRLRVLSLIVLRIGGSTASTAVVDRQGFFVDVLDLQNGETVKLQATFPTYSGNDIVENKTVTANAKGTVFNVGMYAPAGAKVGWASLTATGQTSNKQAQGRVYVLYRPYIFLNKKTIVPNSSFAVNGRGFVSNGQVRVQITIQGSGGNTQTLSATATADNNGNFTKWIRLPGYTSPGTYTVTAAGLLSGIKRYAKLSVSQQPAPKPTAAPTANPTSPPAAHASASVVPDVTLPNQDVTMSGHGFPGNATVTVSVTVDLRGGGNRSITKYANTDNSGNFATAFRVPYKAAPGTYTVTASASGAQSSGNLQVLPLSAHPRNLTFQWTSLWYHTVRQGTWDYITVQSTLKTRLGIWVHVIFPSGYHWDFYRETDSNGKWSVKFTIPRGSASKRSNQAYITFQLWHGKQTTQSFMDFTLV